MARPKIYALIKKACDLIGSQILRKDLRALLLWYRQKKRKGPSPTKQIAIIACAFWHFDFKKGKEKEIKFKYWEFEHFLPDMFESEEYSGEQTDDIERVPEIDINLGEYYNETEKGKNAVCKLTEIKYDRATEEFEASFEVRIGKDKEVVDEYLTTSQADVQTETLAPQISIQKPAVQAPPTPLAIPQTEILSRELQPKEITDEPIKHYFQTKCCDYLENQIKQISDFLDGKMGSKDYYVDPVILYNNKPIFDKNKDEILKSEEKRFVISSNSGHGKTIFLNKYFINHAVNFMNGTQTILPLYFHLSKLRHFNENSFIDFLVSKIFGSGNKIDGIGREEFLCFMDSKLNAGEILLLLDGLDQTQQDGNIPDLLGLGHDGDDDFSQSRVIVASRPLAASNLYRYKKLEIPPFNSQQITEYFKKLKSIDNIKIKKLLQDFFEISETPMLMFLLGNIAQVVSDDEKSKNSDASIVENFDDISKKSVICRSDVYRVFYSKIRTDGLKKFQSKYEKYQEKCSIPNADEMMDQLQIISYIGLVEDPESGIRKKVLNDKIIHVLPHVNKETVTNMGVEGVYDVTDYVKKILCEFGIICNILDEGSGADDLLSLEFRHQSFQAYFAACQLVEEIKKGTINLIDFIKGKTDEAWLEVYRFFTELPEAEDKDKLLISEKMWVWYREQNNKEMLYDAAKAFSGLKIKDSKLQNKLKNELIGLVKIDIRKVVENEKPFRALRDIGEIEYISAYAAKQKTFNTVNRFYAYKYAFSTKENQNITNFTDELFKEGTKPESTAKIDMLFALSRIGTDLALNIVVDFFEETIKTVLPMTEKILLRRRSSKDSYKEWISASMKETKHVAFYCHGNPLYGFREKLQPSRKIFLAQYESHLFKHIYKNKKQKWVAYEDVCINILGITGNEEMVSNFYDDFLVLDNNIANDEELYKQAMASHALSNCFPGDKSNNQEMVNKITSYCIDLFKNGEKNIYRYYIAAALAIIGNKAVIEYFLKFIKRPEEEQLWYGSMVLGCLNDQSMLNELEKLSKEGEERLPIEENDKVKSFASQALLIHSQTYI